MEANLRLRVLEMESLERSKIIVVSSAYCERLHPVAPILIPLTSLSFLTALPKISTHKIKRYREWYPCLAPRLKNSEDLPLF